MKPFKKNNEGFYICEECGRLCKNLCSLGTHISKTHKIKPKIYYDKYIREKDEGYCIECGNETCFDKMGGGYLKFCSTHCMANSKEIRNKYIQTCLNKYGVENTYQSEEKKQKAKQTCFKNYGVEYPGQSEEIKEKIKQNNLENYGVEYNWQREDVKKSIKQTCFERYGDENYTNREKAKNTCLELYGVEYPGQSEEIKNKTKQTCIKRYGVENPQQDKEIRERTQKTAFQLKQFKDTDLWYQGSYELDFLNKHYDKYFDIQRGPSIKYRFEEKNKIYHPDFYIQSLNLVIEIKSSWTYNKTIDDIKEKATIANGFNYLMILEKNYKEFKIHKKLLKSIND